MEWLGATGFHVQGSVRGIATMNRTFALAPLTLIELAPPELVSAAAESGCDARDSRQ